MADGQGILSLEMQDSLQQCSGDENMPHPISAQAFSVSFSPGLFLRAPVTQSELFQLWQWLQSGIVLSFRALQSTEQGRRGSRWMLELQWAQVWV